MRKSRISARGKACGVFERATKFAPECALANRSTSALTAGNKAQSSQDEQYFSGVRLSLSLDDDFSIMWHGGALAAACSAETAKLSIWPVTQQDITGIAIMMMAASRHKTVDMALMLASYRKRINEVNTPKGHPG